MTHTYSTSDIQWMQHAIQLARLAEGFTAPNPCVGAVLVYQDQLIGSGWHQAYGTAHAEVNCIRSVAPNHRPLIPQSTMYVTLEPCAHFGKTPPCAQLLIEEKVQRVVIACTDPFAKVDGAGIDMLKKAGIEVQLGILEKEAIQVNRHFFTLHTKKRPYICLKFAQSADAFMASSSTERLFISNEWSNRWVHTLRGKYQAILVGVDTANLDNPRLDVRYAPGNKNPIPIILDPNARLDLSLRLLHSGRQVIIVTSEATDVVAYQSLPNVEWIQVSKTNFLEETLDALFTRQIISILVEGGARTLQHFIDLGLWDESFVITNTKLQVGEGLSAPALVSARHFNTFEFNADQIDHWVADDNEFYL